MHSENRQDFACVIGGPQGSGVNSTAELYAKLLTRLGYYVYSNVEYHSNIKGKHSYFRVRAANYPVRSHTEDIDLLIALDEETLFGDFYKNYPSHWGHAHQVRSGGTIIYDSDEITDADSRLEAFEVQQVGFPFLEVLNEALSTIGKGGEGKKYNIMNNTVAYGAGMGLLQIDPDQVEQSIRDGFRKKQKVADMNVVAARHAYNYIREEFPEHIRPLFASPGLEHRIMIKGSQAVGLAKIKAGCGFQSYYPITPATDESTYLEEHQDQYPMIIMQTEDEVSSVNMAASAAHGGIRASTSTSGPGFALMPEGLGYAAITEAPGPVVCLYQRGGPSTGIPTRTEQGDLRMAIHAGQGDFPMIVFAPGDMEEYFYGTYDIFNLCDQFQVPAVILYDKYLASGFISSERFDTSEMTIDRGSRYSLEAPQYMRYRFDGSPVSPRAIPGEEGGIFWTSSDEHQPDGHITEGVGNRMAMMHKRMSKLSMILEKYPTEKQVAVYGDPEADVAVVSWGSNKGAILDILDYADEQQPAPFRFVQIRLMHPFPGEAVTAALEGAETIICVEQNWSAQLAGLVQEHTCIPIDVRVLKFDGRPFSCDEMLLGLREAFERPRKRIVISNNGIRDEETWGREEIEQLQQEKARRPRQKPTSVPLPPGYNR
ncbi:MAG TPA: 2-oxoacid:acceptor oxidoreductase subunit alpha [bacterium]|nr:2-oxoacid:acceptor oxidoreductase subunit alpha [bacterium]